MRTVEQLRPGPYDLRRLIEVAAAKLAEIERAARQKPLGVRRITGLAFTDSRNAISGERGTILRRWFPGDGYSAPLAEMLVNPKREDWDVLSSANGDFEIVAYEPDEDVHPVLFAGLWFDEEPEYVYYLARLLVTRLEVEQWADPLVEAHSRGLH